MKKEEVELWGKAQTYQECMKLVPIPTNRASVIPYSSWVGLGRSIKELYRQPLHYLTHLVLKRMDQERHGAENENVPLDMIIPPVQAENTIWFIEEVHRLTTSPHHLFQLWQADPNHQALMDPFYPRNYRNDGNGRATI